MIAATDPFQDACVQWLRHPSLEPRNTVEALFWCDKAASPEVMSFNCWKGRPDGLTAHAYAVDKLQQMKPSPLFRRRFVVSGEVERATAYFCGLGYGKLYLDGIVCGERELDPRQTQYEKRALYVTHDLSDQLSIGEHVLAVELGQGWYSENLAFGNDVHDKTMRDVRNRLNAVYGEGDKSAEVISEVDTPWSYGDPGFVLSLKIEYSDGRVESIVSDTEWTCGTGARLKNGVFSGNCYDARLAEEWTQVDFDDQSWPSAMAVEPLSPELQAMQMPPERCFAEYCPVEISEPKAGVYVFKFERVFAGWQRLSVQAPAGTVISMKWASQLNESGRVDGIADGEQTAGASIVDCYICKGGGLEVWEPSFTYHSGQYIEVEGLSEKPGFDLLTGRSVATDTTETGRFECSDPLLNRIEDALRHTLKSNIHGTVNAMSSRERDQWPVQGAINGRNFMFHFDMREVWKETICDWGGNTNAEGLPYDITPSRREFGPMSYTTTALPVLLRDYHAFYGGLDLIERNFEMAVQGMDQTLKVFAEVPGSYLIVGLGDHCDPSFGDGVPKGNMGMAHNSPSLLIATLGYLEGCLALMDCARLLGRTDVVERYESIGSSVRSAILARYYDAELKTLGSMAGNAGAIRFGVAPTEDIETLLDTIEAELKEREGAFTTGFFGTPALLMVLSDYGRADVAFQIMTRTKFPSYGYYFNKYDAHEIWEYWERTFPGSKPFIGRMQCEKGAAVEWHWRCLGGLIASPSGSALKQFILRPSWPKDLEGASIEYAHPRGRILSQWQRTAMGVQWNVEIPEGSEAYIEPCISGKPPVVVNTASETTCSLEWVPSEYSCRQRTCLKPGCYQLSFD